MGEKGLPDKTTVDVYWLWLDEQCRQSIRHIKDERRKRDAERHQQAKDRGGRLRQAIWDAEGRGLPAGRDERMHARRVVLLAYLLTYQHELKLPGEFCTWQWESNGSLYATLVGGEFVPGRETVLFNPAHRLGDPFGPGSVNINVEGFATLVERAVNVCRADAKTRKPAPAPPTPPAPDAKPEAEDSAVAGEPVVEPVHNADFTMVNWYGTEYTFALGVQSSAMRALWEELEKSGLGLHQDTIRNAIDAERDNFRMDTAFRNHPALGTMIQRCGDGKYKLARPTAKAVRVASKPKKKRQKCA